jgi:hypothetical protein
MSGDSELSTSAKPIEQSAQEPSSQAVEQSSEAARPLSEAALKRRQEILFGPEYFGAESFWDALEYMNRFADLMLPLENAIRRRAKLHRRDPQRFKQSVDRLVEKARFTNRAYRKNYSEFEECCLRMERRYFRERDPKKPRRKFSKDQRRQLGRMVDLFEKFIPVARSAHSEENGGQALAILIALGKKGRGRKPDPDSEKVLALYESRNHKGGKKLGYGAIAKSVWPDEYAKSDPAGKRKLKDRARDIIRGHKEAME